MVYLFLLKEFFDSIGHALSSCSLHIFTFVIYSLIQLPHMLPSEEAFAAAVSALGIENEDGVVVYDGKGIFSSARVWW